ncbi:TraR/DksA C4-type zinc finger protein [Desulfosediminicola sp.]|uniref:TraR/DksA C4-type zinc finger protein n=1 Tax=Desulfosediminicola sp. TaxID=2886825 RepID=UPI003AF27ED8
MDILDRAQLVEQANLADAITAARSSTSSLPSREYCLECEEPISEARRQAQPGCQFCLECKQEQEQRQNGRI